MGEKRDHVACFLLVILISFSCISFAVCLRDELPQISIQKVQQAPVIDGEINDKAWVEVARLFTGVLSGWKNLWGDGLVSNPRISYLCYDDDNLYIASMAFVGDTSELMKQEWDSDGLEVHLDTGENYFQIGAFFDGEKKTAKTSLVFDAATYIDDYYWSVEIAVPWKELGIEPLQGTEIRFNLAGWDYQNGWITWGPSYGSFLDRTTFGYLVLQ